MEQEKLMSQSKEREKGEATRSKSWESEKREKKK